MVLVDRIFDFLLKGMRSAGGLMTAEEVGRYLASVYPVEQVHPVAAGQLLLLASPRFKEVIKGYLWGLPTAPFGLVQDIQDEMKRILEEVNRPLFPKQVVVRFKKSAFYQRNQRGLGDAFVAACLRTHPEIERDPGNRCILKKWSKKRLDEIVQALYEIGRPAHFTVIAERANMLLPPEQRTSAQTVRACMERRTDIFIGLGRGIYWLRDGETDDEGHLPLGNLALQFDRLLHWQAEMEGRDSNVGYDTHTEVEKIRRIGLDFFGK
jgi:hypothetical protein